MILGKPILGLSRPPINFIACAGNEYVVVCENMGEWTTVSFPNGMYCHCVYYEGGTWAVGTSAGLYVSTNGYDWTWVSTPLDSIYGITKDNSGTYYIVGSGATYDIAESTNLADFYVGTAYPFSGNATGVSAGNGNAVASGSGGSTLAFKNNGVWYGTSMYFDNATYAVTNAGGSFYVAVGTDTTGISVAISNADGNYWTAYQYQYHDIPEICYGCASNGSTVLIGGYCSTLPYRQMAYTADGTTWNDCSQDAQAVYGVFYVGGLWYISKENGDLFYSNDLISWSSAGNTGYGIRSLASV